MRKLFISYCHKQGDWVWNRLAPILRATGDVEVLLDTEHFKAGKRIVGQMDATQDTAEQTLLVLSPDYLKSPYCMHEMKRANQSVPILREACSLPKSFTQFDATLYVNLTQDQTDAPWDLLLSSCQAQLNASPPAWLQARDDLQVYLDQDKSANLVVDNHAEWRPLLQSLQAQGHPIPTINLASGTTASRRGLVQDILACFGVHDTAPPPPEDLVLLARRLRNEPRCRHLIFQDFDMAATRTDYDHNLFACLRDLVTRERKLTLIIQSRTPFTHLFPPNHPISQLILDLIELKGRSCINR